MQKIRLLLADDQVLFVESLRTVIEVRAKDIEVVGIAHDGETAVREAAACRPDILLLDVRMPGMDGVEAARLVAQQSPEVKVMMLTTFDDDEYVHEALAHGAVGYMLKNMPPNDLIASIRAVVSGTIQVSPQIMAKLLKEQASPKEPDLAHELSELSRREREILFFLSRGLDNQGIARRLFLAEQTVKNHISHLYAKLGVHERFEAMRRGRELKIESICAYLDQ
jgi:DNA-binding NarL/FixJ family response regulator